MEAFQNLTSPAIILPRDNVDTDLIFPGEHLIVVTRTGLGAHAFQRLRFEPDGTLRSDSPFDHPPYEAARILISGANFGCGSSREHAVWCLHDLGIRVIIAEDFADIFAVNCLQNGVLTIPLAKSEIRRLAASAETGGLLSVDLDAQIITAANGMNVAFKIGAARKQALMQGLDEITRSLQHEAAITAFETRQCAAMPWLYAKGGK